MSLRILIAMTMVLMSLFQASESVAQRAFQRSEFRYSRWEFSMQTRFAAAQGNSGSGGSSLALQQDLGWGFGFGYNFDDRANFGMLFGWRSVPYDATIVSVDDPLVTENYNGRLSTSTIAFSGEWYLLPGQNTPYVSGGLGWVFLDSNIYAGTAVGCWWDPWWGRVCSAIDQTYGTSAFMGSLGLGGRFALSRDMFVRIGYEHAWIDSDAIDGADMIRFDIGILN